MFQSCTKGQAEYNTAETGTYYQGKMADCRNKSCIERHTLQTEGQEMKKEDVSTPLDKI